MNTRILNKDFQHPGDGWYQIEAKGLHPNAAAGVVQVIDDESTESIVNRFNEDAKAGTLRHGGEMLIDHEHFSDQADQETRAYGWLQELQNRDDGIYGRIRWTTTGKAAVDGGDYRFFSTEYAAKDLTVVKNDGKVKQVRPMALDGLTLTNMNNNRGQKPITNREKMKLFNENDTLDDRISNRASKEGIEFRSGFLDFIGYNEGDSVLNRINEAFEASPEKFVEYVTEPDEVDKSVSNYKLLQNRVRRILNGDFLGHPFRGNQYADGKGGGGRHNKASATAHKASVKAHESNDAGDHDRAAAAHDRAANAHEAKGNEKTAAAHRALAAGHRSSAAALRSGESDEKSHKGNPPGDEENSHIPNRFMQTENLESEVEELRNRVNEQQAELCEGILNEHGVIEPKARAVHLRALIPLSNRAERLGYFRDLGIKPGSARVLNRQGVVSMEDSPRDDQARARRLTNRALAIQKEQGGTFGVAFQRATIESAESQNK